MPDSLSDLEARRSTVQCQIALLGDLRSGSISTTGGLCGNPNCHCHRTGDPGHGPYHRLTRKVDGKTVTETFSTPASLAKAQREVAEFHRFRELGTQLLDVNEKICRLRPLEQTPLSAQKKNGGRGPPSYHPRSRPTVAQQERVITVDSKCPLYALFSCWPYAGISVLSWSSTSRCGESRVSALAINSRLIAARPARFPSCVSSSVSNDCSREVSAAPRSRVFS